MSRPRAGGRLWLETFAVFIAGFLLVQVAVALVTRSAPGDAAWPTWLRLGSQWSLALLVFWPVLRGMSFERFRGEVGWHRGRGFIREVGAGMLAYVAALPIYFGLAAILVTIMLLYRQYTGGEEAPPMPSNRVAELLENGGLGIQVLLASLVVLWAPLVEETMFRGALYRAVRSPLGAAGAAVLTAAFFAVMHAYAPLQLILVGTLGLVFALMREWRGSLIPSITAHCLHNSMVLTLMAVMLQLARG
jgi:membrane protease YdiL (CAAX protease family)